ncbi:MAG: recombination mediator RecR [Deltaproteobacteria bacterium]|nr:recombination mediator RecR [Deltaproteobacteria bacterium]
MRLPYPLTKLIDELVKLPSIGNKSARRLAFSLLLQPEKSAYDLAEAIIQARKNIRSCQTCFGFSEYEVCEVCKDEKRNREILCVVEDPKNVFTIESSGVFQGMYHVLEGAISPIQGISPDKLRVKELQQRVKAGQFSEIIIATNSTLEGEATAHYLTDLLQELVEKITRIAMGMPIGSDLEFTDINTLERSFEGRTSLNR